MFSSVFSSLNVPPCLSRKPKRAESEIPSLPEAGPAVLSFERQHGKINGHLLREPLGHTVLQPHGQTALGPVVCCCCWVSLHCLLWEDFKPCAAIKISVFSLFVYLFSPLSSFWSLSLTAFPPKLQLCDKHHSPLLSITLQKKNPLWACCLHHFVWPWLLMWPSALRTSIQMRAQGGFLRCCVYISSLAAPWLPVRQCQGRTTS